MTLPIYANLYRMSTPLASASNALSTTDLSALQAAANQQFIDQVNVAITNATSLGYFSVYATTFTYCDINYLATYFHNLGYTVTYPDLEPRYGVQPAELFGQAYFDYWNTPFLPFGRTHIENPVRMGFLWKNPTA